MVRKIGVLCFGVYASPGYLEKHGELDFEAGSPDHHIVAQTPTVRMPAFAAAWAS